MNFILIRWAGFQMFVSILREANVYSPISETRCRFLMDRRRMALVTHSSLHARGRLHVLHRLAAEATVDRDVWLKRKIRTRWVRLLDVTKRKQHFDVRSETKNRFQSSLFCTCSVPSCSIDCGAFVAACKLSDLTELSDASVSYLCCVCRLGARRSSAVGLLLSDPESAELQPGLRLHLHPAANTHKRLLWAAAITKQSSAA